MNKTPGFHFGQLLRQAREAAGISQRALAIRVGLDVSYINRLESGDRRPRRPTLLKLATALGIQGQDLDAWLAACGLAPLPLVVGLSEPPPSPGPQGEESPSPPTRPDTLSLWQDLEAIGLDEGRIRRLLHSLSVSRAHRREAAAMVADTLNLAAEYLLTPVHKAIIPAAGGQHRLLATPIMQRLLLQMMAEAASAGVYQFMLILPPGTAEALYRPLQTALAMSVAPRFTVDFCIQSAPRGLGDAVLHASAWVGAEPFLVLLPDEMLDRRLAQDLPRELPHMSQAFQQLRQAPLVAVEPAPKSRLLQGGVVLLGPGTPNPRIFAVEELLEKPAPGHPISDSATSRSIVGRYFLPPEIFPALEHLKQTGKPPLELTEALEHLRGRGTPVFAYELKTSRRDLGGVIGRAGDLIGEI